MTGNGSGRELCSKPGPERPSAGLESLVGFRTMRIFRHETRARGFALVAHPNLAVRMQAGAAGGGHGAGAGAMEQARISLAAARMDAAIVRNDLFPCRLALGIDGRILQLRAV